MRSYADFLLVDMLASECSVLVSVGSKLKVLSGIGKSNKASILLSVSLLGGTRFSNLGAVK